MTVIWWLGELPKYAELYQRVTALGSLRTMELEQQECSLHIILYRTGKAERLFTKVQVCFLRLSGRGQLMVCRFINRGGKM